MNLRLPSLRVLGVGLLGLVLFNGVWLGVSILHSPSTTLPTNVAQVLDTINIPFVPNQGQFDDDRLFGALLSNGNFAINTHGLRYSITDEGQWKSVAEFFVNEDGTPLPLAPIGQTQTTATVNYYFENNPENWHEQVPTYQTLSLGEVYEGIQVDLSIRNREVEKLFTVMPGAAVDTIQVALSEEYLQGLWINEAGDLQLKQQENLLYFSAPKAWQVNGSGEKEAVYVSYRLIEGRGYGFTVGDYDHNRPLYIDPLMISKYLGTGTLSLSDRAEAMAFDSSGNVYVAGYTASTTHTAGNANAGQEDLIVLKLTSTLTLTTATYIGTTADEPLGDMAIDTSDNIYVVGDTNNASFPGISGTTYSAGGDTVVSKLNSSLTLVKSAYLGGTGGESGKGITTDSSGNVYVVGSTTSSDFPTTTGPAIGGSQDMYAARFDSNLVRDRSRFIGGSSTDTAETVQVDGSGNVYVGGWTQSSNFPTATPYQAALSGGQDAALSKLDSSFALSLSTYLGGTLGTNERILDMKLHSNGNLYYTGFTPSTNFPLAPAQAGVMIGSVNSSLTPQVTFIPTGASNTTGNGLYIPSSGEIFVVGDDTGGTFPVTDASTPNALTEVIIAHLDANLMTLLDAAYVGGSGHDIGYDLVVDVTGAYDTVFFAGRSRSNDYPVTDGSSPQVGSTEIMMVTRYEFIDTTVTPVATLTPDSSNATNVLHEYDVTVVYPFGDNFRAVFQIPADFGNFDNLTPSDVDVTGTNITSTTVTIDDVERTITLDFDATGSFTNFVVTVGDGVAGGLNDLTSPSDPRGYPILITGFNQYGAEIWTTTMYAMISTGIDFNVTIPEALVMIINNIGINLIVDPLVNNGRDVSQYTEMTVRSNATNGYTLYVELDDGTGVPQLRSAAGDTIATGTSENNFGYMARNAAYNSGQSVTADASFTNPSSIVYSNSTRIGGTGVTAGTGDLHTVYYEMDVDFLPPAGEYSGTITYTVVSNF